jgi:hypothetical protein
LNVTYTTGAASKSDDGKTWNFSGLKAGALNVVVSDQTGSRSWAGDNTAISFVNPGTNDLSHEMAHQFGGDTRGAMNWIQSHDPIFTGQFLNAYSDISNDFERTWMRNLESNSGAFSHYPLASAFNHNAGVFQRSIQPTTKPQ